MVGPGWMLYEEMRRNQTIQHTPLAFSQDDCQWEGGRRKVEFTGWLLDVQAHFFRNEVGQSRARMEPCTDWFSPPRISLPAPSPSPQPPTSPKALKCLDLLSVTQLEDNGVSPKLICAISLCCQL